MFENFLSDPKIYEELEKTVERSFAALLEKEQMDGKNFNTLYYNTKFADGSPFMNGNPIFSVKHIINGDTLRIVIDNNTTESTLADKNIDNSHDTCIIGRTYNLCNIDSNIHAWIKKQKYLLYDSSM